MGGRSGGGAGMGRGARSGGGGGALQGSWSQGVFGTNTYNSNKAYVMLSNETKYGKGFRVQVQEGIDITPKGATPKSDVKYFKTEKQAKNFANKFIKASEGKPTIPKPKSLPKFTFKKHGNLSGL